MCIRDRRRGQADLGRQQIHGIPPLGDKGIHPLGLGEESRKGLRRGRLPVDHKNCLRLLAESAQPPQQAVAVGVRRQPVDVFHGGADGNLTAEDPHPFLPLQQPASQCALRLKAHQHHRIFAVPEMIFQMVTDPAGVAHSRGRDDDAAALITVDALGVV